MKPLAVFALAGVLGLAGCATAPEQTCPVGQEPTRMAQLFFGRSSGATPSVSEDSFRKFVDEEITPRFPDGLTVLDGGGQWRGDENQLIREASKVVLIVLPKKGDRAKLNQVREAYKKRFAQESVLLVTQQSCVSF